MLKAAFYFYLVNKEAQYGLKGFIMAILFCAIIKSGTLFFEKDFAVVEEKSSFFCGTVDQSTYYISTSGIDGKALFSQNCASCHAIHKQLTGPALAGIENRVTDRKMLHRWIRDSEEVLKSQDPYFTTLYNQFNQASMSKFPNLKDEEIDAILDYIAQPVFVY
ncbi:cytochrome c [Panacibacter sp. DH6]|uniref:Cytochrome c n=1 Tax=Panacibacter microcysteis TaxID=2793269 RepID=A0A931GXQ1_9BACT|nr:cytochrome c [Panacibacter microcysteis]MBG9376304.1 cytochrome c [Panacibacter microcysteis]